jgi:hypothetical protein
VLWLYVDVILIVHSRQLVILNMMFLIIRAVSFHSILLKISYGQRFWFPFLIFFFEKVPKKRYQNRKQMKREGILNIMYYCVTFNRISGRQGKHLSKKKKFFFTMIVLVTFRMRGKVLVILMPILMM